MKFQVYQSYWGMSSLPFGGEEWSMAASWRRSQRRVLTG